MAEEDVNPANDATECNVMMTSVAITKRVLMEEATGLYCGNCPRGIVSINTMHEEYPDNFIAIARHNYTGTPSELLCPSYEYADWGVYPHAAVDRRVDFDPDPTTTRQYVNAILNNIQVVAGIDAKANFVAGDYSHINVNADVQFTKDFTNCNFALALAIIEDNVTKADGSLYAQNNAYAGGSWGTMGGWESKGSMVSIVLNHVARAGYGVKSGIDNSIPSGDVNSNTIYNYNTVISVPSNVRDRNNIKVVAFLINRGDGGYVENAIEVPVLEAGETAITETTTTLTPDVEVRDGRVVADGFDGKLQVYTVNGQQVKNEALARGIYIVRGISGKQNFVKKITF